MTVATMKMLESGVIPESWGLICALPNEPVRDKTNNLSSDQVRHKPGCTVEEDC